MKLCDVSNWSPGERNIKPLVEISPSYPLTWSFNISYKTCVCEEASLVDQFREMTKALHMEGLELVLELIPTASSGGCNQFF